MIRLGTIDDIPALVEMGRSLVAESPRFCRVNYSPGKVAKLLTAWMHHDNGLVLVAEHAGEVVGVVVAMQDEEWFSEDPVAQEMVLTVTPNKRGSAYAGALIDGMDAWAAAKGVRYLQAGTSTLIRPELAIKLYEKRGYRRAAIGVEKVFY